MDSAPLGPALPLGFPPTSSIPNGPAHTSLTACRPESYDECCKGIEPEHKPVCIGTLQFGAKFKNTGSRAEGVIPITYHHGGQLTPISGEGASGAYGLNIGHIPDARWKGVLSDLLKADDVSLEFFCRRMKGTRGCVLVNICTVPELVTEFGTFFDRLGLFLQDPVAYGTDLPYQNPHLLSHLEANLVMLSSLYKGADLEQFSAPSDIFDDLLMSDKLPESKAPSLISTSLLSHQRQALSFMQQRERSSPSGGLLADQMGLGKTLQMISLIASDHDGAQHHAHCDLRDASPATLVIVPLSLLATWKDQFKEHVSQQRLRIYVHYGPDRARAADYIGHCDVVLTTYDVVAAEFRKFETGFPSVMLATYWRRVILDEAHLIKNPVALRTNAVVQIQSQSRWAVTGTPIQNRLSDLSALFRFLRYVPYDDPANFRREILEPWRLRSDINAVKKLKQLLHYVAIRRSKALLDLPHREDRIHHIEFSPSEAVSYEEERTSLQRHILEADPSDSRSYPNVLRWIDRLRGFCSRGEQSDVSSATEDMDINSQAGDEEGLEDDKPLIDDFWKDDQTDSIDQGISAQGSSDTTMIEVGSSLLGDEPCQRSSNLTPTPQNTATPEDSVQSAQTSFSSPLAGENHLHLPTKINALVRDITNHAGKCVVFSFWRSTLTVAGIALVRAGLRHVRIDGQLSKMAREQVITQFREDQNIRVMLATISVAAVGLDLTVANLACLLEPQWNPSVEEQALSRVHRMRQRLPVTTIRYVVRNSIEDSILELQKRKLQLAQLALSGDTSLPSVSALEELRSLVQ